MCVFTQVRACLRVPPHRKLSPLIKECTVMEVTELQMVLSIFLGMEKPHEKKKVSVCTCGQTSGERMRRDHDRNINREAASPTVSLCPGAFTAATGDINHWISKPCLIASCISLCVHWLKGKDGGWGGGEGGAHYFRFAGWRAGGPHLIWTGPPLPSLRPTWDRAKPDKEKWSAQSPPNE